MKKYLFVFLILILFTGGGYCWLSFSSKVKLITSEQGSFLEMAQGLVEELNKLPGEDLPNKKIDFYVANFTNNNISKIRNKNHYNILYLGSRRGFDIEKIQGFDRIFVSTPDLKAYFEEQGINTEFLQISWKDKGITADINNKDKWLLIGENSETEKELRNLGINYDKINSFALENEKKILEKLSEIKGVIIENPYISEESLDFSPLVLEIIARKIPILTNSEVVSYFFNDVLSYYIYEDIKVVLDLDKTKLNNAYELYKNMYENKKVINNIFYSLKKIKDIVSINHWGFAGNYNNGEYWLINDIAKEFKNNSYKTHTYYASSVFKNIGNINLYFLGVNFMNIEENDEKINILYVLYVYDLSTFLSWYNEWKLNIDVVVVSSKKFRDFLNQDKEKIYYLPQFTNPNRFYPDYDEALKSDILFVGNNYIERKAPRIALKHNLPITIYGKDWKGQAVAEYVDNRILRKYYSSAKINLNDHRPDMIENGFINNRTFDVTASGGFLISDYMPEIEEIYGDSIPMWKTEEELVELLNYYLDPVHEEERLEKAARAREITLKNFTSDIIAEKFDEIIKELKREKGLD